jgi:hypothetical protein
MRGGLCLKSYARFAYDGKSQRRRSRYGQCREILLIKNRFREGLNWWSSPLIGCCATSLVRTASRLTRLRAWRIGHDARSCWQSNGRGKKRRDDCKRNHDPAEHHLIDSTPGARRRVGKHRNSVLFMMTRPVIGTQAFLACAPSGVALRCLGER